MCSKSRKWQTQSQDEKSHLFSLMQGQELTKTSVPEKI